LRCPKGVVAVEVVVLGGAVEEVVVLDGVVDLGAVGRPGGRMVGAGAGGDEEVVVGPTEVGAAVTVGFGFEGGFHRVLPKLLTIGNGPPYWGKAVRTAVM
jgi:hypothetical protein